MKASFDLSQSRHLYASQTSVDGFITDKIIPFFDSNQGINAVRSHTPSTALTARVAQASQQTAALEAVAYVSLEIAAAALVTISLLS
jgi:hypothetical protein